MDTPKEAGRKAGSPTLWTGTLLGAIDRADLPGSTRLSG